MMESTLVIIKPHAIREGKVGEIISRLEAKSLHIQDVEFRTLDGAHVDELYAAHADKTWYVHLRNMMLESTSMLMVLTGHRYIDSNMPHISEVVRNVIGDFDKAGSIRGDLAKTPRHNCVHGSDSPESATFEVNWFYKIKNRL